MIPKKADAERGHAIALGRQLVELKATVAPRERGAALASGQKVHARSAERRTRR